MSLSDSLMPDRPLVRQLDAKASGAVATPSPVETLFARTDATIDGEFASLFGANGLEARASLERSATTEGPAAYDRFRANPDAFGAVVGERERADTVGGALEALNYSKAYHAAEQEGRVPSVPGYGVAPQEPELSIGAYDGIYLDGEGNQIGRFGTPSDRLFVVIDAAQAGQMRQDWNAHTNTTETLQSPIRGALEIPSLTALRAMHEDITSHRWSENEISGLWGVDASGQSHIGLGGIGSTGANSARPGAMRDGLSSSPKGQLDLAGAAFRGSYHSHPLYDHGQFSRERNNVSTAQGRSDRTAARTLDRSVVGSPLSVNVLMNPNSTENTTFFTSQGDLLRVRTNNILSWSINNGVLVK